MRRPAILALTLLGGAFAAAPAHADSCVDLRTGTTYDCAGKPPEPTPEAKKPRRDDTKLRRDLKAALAQKAREEEAKAAIAAAGQACSAGDSEGFDRQIELATKLATPKQAPAIDSLRASCGASGSRAQSAPREQPAQAEAPPQDSNEPPKFGEDERRRDRIWAKLPPRCRTLINRMIKGADTADREATLSSYGMLRAECGPQIAELAKAAYSDLPERSLSPRASSALARAMSRDPNQLIQSLPDRADDSSFDPGEIADFALGLLSIMPSARGIYTPVSNGRAASFSGGSFRRAAGAPPPRSTPSSQSTITGGSR